MPKIIVKFRCALYSIKYGSLGSGYGHQSPLSAEGKSFCIIYALIGIPMTLLLLTAVVERLLIPGIGVDKLFFTFVTDAAEK
jgi:hypothetical protein